MHEVLVNRLGGLSLPRKSVVRLTDRPDMTLDVYRGRKTTIQFNNKRIEKLVLSPVYSPVFTNGETRFLVPAKYFALINRCGFLSAQEGIISG